MEETEDVQKLFALLNTSSDFQRHEEHLQESPSSVRSQVGSPTGEVSYEDRLLATQGSCEIQAAGLLSTQVRFAEQSESRNESPSSHPHKYSASDKEYFVELLAMSRKGGTSTTKPKNISPAITGQPLYSTPLKPVVESRIEKKTSRLHSKANIQGSGNTTSISSSHKVENAAKTHVSSKQVQNSQKAHGAYSDDSEKENSQENVRKIAIVIEPKDTIPPTHHNQESPHPQEIEPERNPWEGHIRLPRMYVQMPKEQRKLLERDDSWYSAHSGDGTKFTKLPLDVMVDLQKFHDRSTATLEDKVRLRKAVSEETPENMNNFGEKDVGNSYQESYEGSAICRPDSPRTTSQPMLNAAQEGEEYQDDDSDEVASSWSLSQRLDPNSPVPSPTRHTSSPFCETDRTNDIASKPKNGYLDPSSRSVSPSLNGTEQLDLPASPEITSFQADTLTTRTDTIVSSNVVTRNVKPLSQMFSSSPMEMESAVPYGIDELFASSNKKDADGVVHSIETMPSTDQRTITSLQVARTPHVQAHPPQSFTTHGEIDYGPKDPQREFYSSDPVIPGTIDNEGIKHPGISAANVSHTNHDRRFAEQRSAAIGFSSALLSSPVHSPTRPLSPLSNKYQVDSANDQPCAEFVSYSQRSQPGTQSESSSSTRLKLRQESPDNHPGASSHTDKTPMPKTSSMTASLDSDPNFCHTLVPATQVSSLSDHVLFISTNAASNTQAHSPKPNTSAINKFARSSLSHADSTSPIGFGFSQEETPAVDISAMVRANRRKFIRQLSNSSQDSTDDIEQGVYLQASATIFLRGSANHETGRAHSENLESLTPSRMNDGGSKASSAEFKSLDSFGSAHNSIRRFDSSPDGRIIEDDLVEAIVDSSLGVPLLEASGSRADQDRNTMPVRGQPDDFYDLNEGRSHGIPDEVDCGSEKSLPTLLDQFRLSYPAYNASDRRFIKACTYLEWLKNDKRAAPHPSLWDDFIRAWCDDYLTYIRNCKPGEEKMSGIDFYNEFVTDPKFTNRVITPGNLQEALLLDPVETERAMAPFHKLSNYGSKKGSVPVASTRTSVGSYTVGSPSLKHDKSDRLLQTPNDDMVLLQYIHTEQPLPNGVDLRKPFFETFSQLGNRDHPVIVPVAGTPVTPLKNNSSPLVVDIAGTKSSKRRAIPWPSSPSMNPESVRQPVRKSDRRASTEGSLVPDPHSSTPNQVSRKQRKSIVQKTSICQKVARMPAGCSLDSKYAPHVDNEQWISAEASSRPAHSKRMASAVVNDRITTKPIGALEASTNSGGSPILGTRVFPLVDIQREEFITSGDPASKLPSRKTISTSRPHLSPSNNFSNKINERNPARSVPSKRKLSPLSFATPTKRPAWDEFMKSYIPRRNRLSSMPKVGSIGTIETLAINSLKGENLPRAEYGSAIEPETQDWNCDHGL